MKIDNDYIVFIGSLTSPVINNPLTISLLVNSSIEGGNVPPPSSNFIITQSGLNIITLSGEKFITDN